MITEQHREEYFEKGYTVLHDVIDETQLQKLREDCAYFVGYIDASMKARDREVYGITHRGKRYFIAGRWRQRPRMAEFLFSSLMADVTRAFLGDEVMLFNEQWVVKGPDQGMKFAWHQDSGYVHYRDPGNTHEPYLTCWCALDDMSEENGTIFVLPHTELDTYNTVLPHEVEPGTNDLVGYRGDKKGEAVEISAGSIAVFSSTILHSSGANTTQDWRRVYLTQYSKAPIYKQDGAPWNEVIPFLKNGIKLESVQDLP